MRNVLFFILFLFAPLFTLGQGSVVEKRKKATPDIAQNQKDTIKGYLLEDVVITADNSEYLSNLASARYFIARVYPYARQAADLIESYDEKLATLEKEREKRKFIRQANKELREEFGDEIRDMSITRGRYLVKLIHRETGKTAYSIIKEYKNGVSALSWQTLGALGGANLKIEYDPEGEDWIVEQVMKEIEDGTLKIVERPAKTEAAKTATKNRKERARKKRKKGES